MLFLEYKLNVNGGDVGSWIWVYILRIYNNFL